MSYPFFSRDNEIEGATLATSGGTWTNTANLQNRLTDRVASVIRAGGGFAGVRISWGGAERSIGCVCVHEHNGANLSSLQARLVLYSDDPPTVIVANSDYVNLPVVYGITPMWTEIDLGHWIFTFKDVSEGRLVPLNYTCRTASVDFLLPDSESLQIGYIWVGAAETLDESSAIGAKHSTGTDVPSRPDRAQGGGIAAQDDVNTHETQIEFPVLTARDRHGLRSLHEAVGTTQPFFLHLRPDVGVPRDREAEGGVVRFVDKQMKLQSLGHQRGTAEDLYTMAPISVTRWR